ncbi:aspartyl/glutamyl-tRNA amidotransferase subunit A [Candidatus Omnitrophus magneticus]|uniref:Glutamyl-tRNA(Gln) amidotransferase subunit A n=1 Tax=Candidatus Omnitrophus magneticus TaxID=1609969 RepID=A0A0F0CQQ9_9BACT|nr:aspartyl/glutamyl-tRNA amidotransferase subunit A [Candidatus Omnitrophus magneticus]
MEDILSSIESFCAWRAKQNISIKESVEILASRILEIEKSVHAFSHFDKKAFIEKAELDNNLSKNGILSGIPIAIKSNICVKGELTDCSSRILEGFRPPYNATVVEKLLAHGALIASGANMDEFAFGSSCETSYFGPTKNPWDITRIPGGSSGGSAASVSSGEVLAALGSDTGGSIRQPAAMCGVVGLKPTYGRVSRYGLIAFASSLDQIGPITRNVADSACILEIISGYDNRDSTSVNMPVPRYTKMLGADIKGVKIGLPSEYFEGGIDEDVLESVRASIELFKKLGAEIVNISLPNTKYALSCYYIIGPSEASSNLARYDGAHYGYRAGDADDIISMYTKTRNEGFGTEAKRRILIGTYALSAGYYDAYYLKAQKVRTKIADDFKEAFKSCDCILTPTAPSTAFKIGEKMNDPLKMYLSDIFTIPANLAGIPSMSIPCGFSRESLPIGLQIMAKAFDEETIIRVADAFERHTEYSQKYSLGRENGK